MKSLAFVFAVVMLGWIWVAPGWAGTAHYVDCDADNPGNGESADSPWTSVAAVRRHASDPGFEPVLSD